MKNKKIEKALLEFTKDITDHYTIVVQDEAGRKRFTFKDHRVKALEKELKKHYGDQIVSKICNKIKKAETEGKLTNFAIDDSVDFIVTGKTVSAVFNDGTGREENGMDEDTINELHAEYVGRGVPYNKIFSDNTKKNIIPKEKLKDSEWLNTLNQVVTAIKKAGLEDKFSPDEGAIDIQPSTKGLLTLTADDGSKYIYNISRKQITSK